MPRNRQHIPREERTGDLLHAARELFVAKGYVGTTIADISEAAGVARANVYWYWKSKDDVFAAVMNQMLDEEMGELDRQNADMPADEQLVTGLAHMYRFRPLHREMHERLDYSAAVRDAHDTFLAWVRGLVVRAVEQHSAPIDTELAADIVVSTFEGSHVAQTHQPAHIMLRSLLAIILAGSLRTCS